LKWNSNGQMIPKLSAACYAVRLMVHISNINILKSICYAYFHSITKYGTIFEGNSSNSERIFTLQKKIVRIMAAAQPHASCSSLFKQLEILPVPRRSILSLRNFIINSQENFQTYSSIHNINRRKKLFIYQIETYLVFQKVNFMLAPKFSTIYHLV